MGRSFLFFVSLLPSLTASLWGEYFLGEIYSGFTYFLHKIFPGRLRWVPSFFRPNRLLPQATTSVGPTTGETQSLRGGWWSRTGLLCRLPHTSERGTRGATEWGVAGGLLYEVPYEGRPFRFHLCGESASFNSVSHLRFLAFSFFFSIGGCRDP